MNSLALQSLKSPPRAQPQLQPLPPPQVHSALQLQSPAPAKAQRISLPDRLAQDLRRRLLAGEWSMGQAIPAETALAASYSVSRNTIREAISRLVTEGQLRIQRGIGTIVSPPAPPQAPMGMGHFLSLTESILQQGRTPRIVLHKLERRPGTAEETARLELPAGAQIVYTERAIYSNDDLLSYGYDRYVDDLFPEVIDESLFSMSFVDIFERLGVPADKTHVQYHAVHSSTIGWDRANAKPQLYVLLDRVHWARGRLIFHAQTYCVEGRNQIYTTNSR